jgi:metal-responsive CopG/Arc/MetJ family transcriptional regulator
MATQRLTVSLPDYLYDRLQPLLQERQLSSFVAEAVEEKILARTQKDDPVEAFLGWRRVVPKFSNRQILAAIRKGRT